VEQEDGHAASVRPARTVTLLWRTSMATNDVTCGWLPTITTAVEKENQADDTRDRMTLTVQDAPSNVTPADRPCAPATWG
jgi:hypothetical protein